MDKELYGLSLMEYKGIELEAHAQLIAGRKIVLVSQLMLTHAKKLVKNLGGKTMEEEDALEKVRVANDARNTTTTG